MFKPRPVQVSVCQDKYINEEFRCKNLLSAAWNVLLKWAILSASYIYVQFFYFNCIEKDKYIAIKVKLLKPHIRAW